MTSKALLFILFIVITLALSLIFLKPINHTEKRNSSRRNIHRPSLANQSPSSSKQINIKSVHVVHVADGDTLVIIEQNAKHRIRQKVRLAAVDCPELAQAYGIKARAFTQKFTQNKKVKLHQHGKDRYGRLLVDLYVDKNSLQHALLRAGLAWHYSYHDRSPVLKRLEKRARLERKGLWNDPNPIKPYYFRKSKR